MKTNEIKRIAQKARRQLIQAVGTRLEHVLSTDKSAWREKEKAIEDLNAHIRSSSKEYVIEKVAYTWFNRFCALRYMDVHGYNRIQVVSPLSGHTQPEILLEAKQGHIEEKLLRPEDQKRLLGLLSGTISSPNGQAEAYQMLLVATCNTYNSTMPFMFERIQDYSELLMPSDLLSEDSILNTIREAMDEENASDIEIIGWLYQYYISEKKDEVFASLKKNIKITAENIPSATQLFTPHWIVRYMVENSLGRLWMLNHPESNLKQKMDYYIEPTEPETDYLKIVSPEEIKICDPACGSGHILVYAFDLIYAIYEEAGYSPSEIPGHILQKNLFGIEIDPRAGALSAFALFMKAVEKQKQILKKPIQPNICILENVIFEDDELAEYIKAVGLNLFTAELNTLLHQFTQVDYVGSLIQPVAVDFAMLRKELDSKDLESHLFLSRTHERVLKVLDQAEYLSQRYHVVVANPPYMGGKGMPDALKAYAEKNYPNSKSDLFAMFIERNLELSKPNGMVAMITMQSWMFLSSFEGLRDRILDYSTILSMAHLGARAFDSIGGEVVQTTAFVIKNSHQLSYKGIYLRLVDGSTEAEKAEMLLRTIKK